MFYSYLRACTDVMYPHPFLSKKKVKLIIGALLWLTIFSGQEATCNGFGGGAFQCLQLQLQLQLQGERRSKCRSRSYGYRGWAPCERLYNTADDCVPPEPGRNPTTTSYNNSMPSKEDLTMKNASPMPLPLPAENEPSGLKELAKKDKDAPTKHEQDNSRTNDLLPGTNENDDVMANNNFSDQTEDLFSSSPDDTPTNESIMKSPSSTSPSISFLIASALNITSDSNNNEKRTIHYKDHTDDFLLFHDNKDILPKGNTTNNVTTMHTCYRTTFDKFAASETNTIYTQEENLMNNDNATATDDLGSTNGTYLTTNPSLPLLDATVTDADGKAEARLEQGNCTDTYAEAEAEADTVIRDQNDASSSCESTVDPVTETTNASLANQSSVIEIRPQCNIEKDMPATNLADDEQVYPLDEQANDDKLLLVPSATNDDSNCEDSRLLSGNHSIDESSSQTKYNNDPSIMSETQQETQLSQPFHNTPIKSPTTQMHTNHARHKHHPHTIHHRSDRSHRREKVKVLDDADSIGKATATTITTMKLPRNPSVLLQRKRNSATFHQHGYGRYLYFDRPRSFVHQPRKDIAAFGQRPSPLAPPSEIYPSTIMKGDVPKRRMYPGNAEDNVPDENSPSNIPLNGSNVTRITTTTTVQTPNATITTTTTATFPAESSFENFFATLFHQLKPFQLYIDGGAPASSLMPSENATPRRLPSFHNQVEADNEDDITTNLTHQFVDVLNTPNDAKVNLNDEDDTIIADLEKSTDLDIQKKNNASEPQVGHSETFLESIKREKASIRSNHEHILSRRSATHNVYEQSNKSQLRRKSSIQSDNNGSSSEWTMNDTRNSPSRTSAQQQQQQQQSTDFFRHKDYYQNLVNRSAPEDKRKYQQLFNSARLKEQVRFEAEKKASHEANAGAPTEPMEEETPPEDSVQSDERTSRRVRRLKRFLKWMRMSSDEKDTKE